MIEIKIQIVVDDTEVEFASFESAAAAVEWLQVQAGDTSAPRTWSLPLEPEDGTRVRDRVGREWSRRPIDSGTYWVSDLGGAAEWIGVLRNGPLTEVVETEVEAAARRLRAGGLDDPNKLPAYPDKDLITDARTVLAHVLNGGSL